MSSPTHFPCNCCCLKTGTMLQLVPYGHGFLAGGQGVQLPHAGAIGAGVAYAPGMYFSAPGGDSNMMWLGKGALWRQRQLQDKCAPKMTKLGGGGESVLCFEGQEPAVTTGALHPCQTMDAACLFKHDGGLPWPGTGKGPARLRWTADLHARFVEAVNALGGPEKATPKGMRRIYSMQAHAILPNRGAKQEAQPRPRPQGPTANRFFSTAQPAGTSRQG